MKYIFIILMFSLFTPTFYVHAGTTTSSIIINPKISVSSNKGTQLSTTFKITGTGFTPLYTITGRLKKLDGQIIRINIDALSDANGNVTWNLTPTCDTEIGISTIWLIDDDSNIGSNKIPLNIHSSQNCKGMFESDFSASSATGPSSLKVTFTDNSKSDPFQGKPESWAWNFGDGKTSSEKNPQHTYSVPGLYTVSLMASNSHTSDWEIKNNFISVEPGGTPTARFEASHFIGIAPMKVQFNDTSDGNPVLWMWDFGDGTTSSLQNPLHTYKEPGFYTVSFTASNSVGTDSKETSNLINVKDAGEPIVKFMSEPITGFSPLTINFTDISSGNIGSWKWDFSGSNTSSLQNPSHTFKEAGIFTVKLTVDGSRGSGEASKTIEVLDGLGSDSNLSSAFTGKPRISIPGTEVEFTDLSSGNVDGWFWNFGDNGTSTLQNPKHTYVEKGIYALNLTVFNNEGKANTKTKLAYIEITSQTIPSSTLSPTPTPTLTLTATTSPVATPVSTPIVTPDINPAEVLTPTAEPVPSVSPTPTPIVISQVTPQEQNFNNLLVEPTKAIRTLRFQQAIVTAIDASGNPIPNVTIKAFTNGLNAIVTPISAVTGDDGTILFKFRFSSFTNNSTIIFESGSQTTSIKQE